jgi:hypothetical protein
MVGYFGPDARRVHHALKVYAFASCIARSENVPEEVGFVVEAAAVLHDIGIHEAERKYGSSAGPYQEKEGPAVAETLVGELLKDNQAWQRILFLIGHHHSYTMVDGIDFQILIEADFLVNAYEDALSLEAVKAMRARYFRTATGTALLDSLYP